MKTSPPKEYYRAAEVADMLSVSKETLRRWNTNGKLVSTRHPITNHCIYSKDQLIIFDQAKLMFNSRWDEEIKTRPKHPYTGIELFAGAGGLALGLEMAGFEHLALNELVPDACETLRRHRPKWKVREGDVAQISFEQ